MYNKKPIGFGFAPTLSTWDYIIAYSLARDLSQILSNCSHVILLINHPTSILQ